MVLRDRGRLRWLTCGRTGSSLLAADAAALPLRDKVADLAFANHMLYHVPDPATAIGELRRVTRPGGRVVVVLNGADHLRELRALLEAAHGDDTPPPGERLRLDAGEALLRAARRVPGLPLSWGCFAVRTLGAPQHKIIAGGLSVRHQRVNHAVTPVDTVMPAF